MMGRTYACVRDGAGIWDKGNLRDIEEFLIRWRGINGNFAEAGNVVAWRSSVSGRVLHGGCIEHDLAVLVVHDIAPAVILLRAWELVFVLDLTVSRVRGPT